VIVKHPLFPHGLKPASFVLDASVALTWVQHGHWATYAADVMRELNRKRPVVPVSWLMHLGQLVVESEWRGQLSAAHVDSRLAIIRGFPILFDNKADTYSWSDTLALARAHLISVHDAAYLELALRVGLPLATIDAALARAAAAAGVPLFAP
jgi:predicted nucleic acid-binding protein